MSSQYATGHVPQPQAEVPDVRHDQPDHGQRDRTIAAWGESGGTPAQRMKAFAVVVDNSDSGAIDKGVTVSAETGTGNLLYAINFSQGRIDLFDAHWQPVASVTFAPQALGGRDASEFAPFNIERVFDASLGREVLIVAYAKVANGEGGEGESTDGFVAKFDIDGTFLRAGLYFTAGPDEEAEGLFGSLSVEDGVDADRSFDGTSAADVFGGASGDDAINGGDGDSSASS
jgi:hypothetical protein